MVNLKYLKMQSLCVHFVTLTYLSWWMMTRLSSVSWLMTYFLVWKVWFVSLIRNLLILLGRMERLARLLLRLSVVPANFRVPACLHHGLRCFRGDERHGGKGV